MTVALFCAPCAAAALAEHGRDPTPRRADYVIDGLSLCGVCALPHLYDLAANLPARPRDTPAESSDCRHCRRKIHRVRDVYWEDDRHQMVCPARNGAHEPA